MIRFTVDLGGKYPEKRYCLSYPDTEEGWRDFKVMWMFSSIDAKQAFGGRNVSKQLMFWEATRQAESMGVVFADGIKNHG